METATGDSGGIFDGTLRPKGEKKRVNDRNHDIESLAGTERGSNQIQ